MISHIYRESNSVNLLNKILWSFIDRTSALEAAAQDRDAVIEKQRRKINFLKAQLGGVNKVCICPFNFKSVF